MFGKKNVETLVAGAGPSGMIAALTLVDGGHDVLIIDSASGPCTSSNAALLHPATLQTLERLNIAQRVIDAGYPVHQISLYDGLSQRHTVHLDRHARPFPFALSISQSELEVILEDELEQADTRILWNRRVSDFTDSEDGLKVVIDRSSERGTGYAVSHTERVIDKSIHYNARRIVAADGYNSILRRIAGVEQKPLGASQCFLYFEFDTDRDPDHRMLLSFKDGLSTAQQPIQEGIARLQFQLEGLTLSSRDREKSRSYYQDKADIPSHLDEASFRELIETRVPWDTGYVNTLRYRAAVPFEKRYLKNPRQGNVFFIGDSARSFSPIGSLSINLGIQEAVQIAQAILEFQDNPAHLAIRTEELGAQMVQNWEQLGNLHGHLTKSCSTDPWVTANQAKILCSFPATGETLADLASELHIILDQEPIHKTVTQ